jgi:hypothetical protein
MTERVDAFAKLDRFKPKTTEQAPVDNAAIEKISKDNNFPSRDPKPSKRPRYNASGPKKQLNIKVSDECHNRFYRIAEARGIRVLGDLIEQALDALERKT